MAELVEKQHELVKPKGKTPDYKGDGVAVWLKEDKNGKTYLSICVLSSINCAAFAYEPKQKN